MPEPIAQLCYAGSLQLKLSCYDRADTIWVLVEKLVGIVTKLLNSLLLPRGRVPVVDGNSPMTRRMRRPPCLLSTEVEWYSLEL